MKNILPAGTHSQPGIAFAIVCDSLVVDADGYVVSGNATKTIRLRAYEVIDGDKRTILLISEEPVK